MSIFDILKFIPTAIDAFGSDKYHKPAKRAAQAQLDPNSPMFQKLYSAERGQGQQDLAFQIAELQRQNRKSTELGRTPLLSPERGGETIFRGLMEGQMKAGDQARRMTVDRLGQGATNLSNIGQTEQMGDVVKNMAYGGIVDAFRPKDEDDDLISRLRNILSRG